MRDEKPQDENEGGIGQSASTAGLGEAIPIPHFLRNKENLAREIAEEAAAYSKPPCQRCGAMTQEEAEMKCCVSGGDDDHCHGCELWPN